MDGIEGFVSTSEKTQVRLEILRKEDEAVPLPDLIRTKFL
jgi:hypothetical protein